MEKMYPTLRQLYNVIVLNREIKIYKCDVRRSYVEQTLLFDNYNSSKLYMSDVIKEYGDKDVIVISHYTNFIKIVIDA